jgi:hypothetical protein
MKTYRDIKREVQHRIKMCKLTDSPKERWQLQIIDLLGNVHLGPIGSYNEILNATLRTRNILKEKFLEERARGNRLIRCSCCNQIRSV